MSHFDNILVAIDFKATEQAEIDHAINLAKMHQAKLTFMSVIPELSRDAHLEISAMSPEQRLERQLEQRMEQLEMVSQCAIQNTGIETECVTVSGTPSVEIIKQIMRNKHDLLMIAERENNSIIKNKLMGSTARELLRKAPCPVLAVHPKCLGDYKRVMATINVNEQKGVDSETLNQTIVSNATFIAEAEKSNLSIMSIIPSQADKTVYMEKIKSCLNSNNVTIADDNIHLEVGEPAQAIIDSTLTHKIDLLVMGMLSRTGIQGFFIGNTVEKVLDTVECSILTIKPDTFVSPIKLDDH
jgi:nucleotide-binding universal stress UspA family protein